MFPASVLAQGGPPLITDDPDTPGPGYWEINLMTNLEKSRLERRVEAPLADINYGVGRRIQLKFEMPWQTVRKTGEPAQTGTGDAIVGVKWRFLGQEGEQISWSTYPQVVLNDGSQFFLPTELTVQKGGIEINGEVGRTFVQHGDNGWSFGVSTEIELPGHLEVLGELHGERSGSSPTELIVDIGGRPKITNQITLLVGVGSGLRGPPGERLQLRLDVGLQFNLPNQFVFSQSTRAKQMWRSMAHPENRNASS